jgi:hypothetical protein
MSQGRSSYGLGTGVVARGGVPQRCPSECRAIAAAAECWTQTPGSWRPTYCLPCNCYSRVLCCVLTRNSNDHTMHTVGESCEGGAGMGGAPDVGHQNAGDSHGESE